LESRQLQYQKATQRLADRATHARLVEEMMQVKHAANEKHKSIGVRQSSMDELKQKISDLSVRREALLAELKQVEEALTQAQQEESQLPEVLKILQQERDTQGRKALYMRKKLKQLKALPMKIIKK